ncbi:MAG: thioredoxin domain-containing protein, partial [Rhodospirillales bacterium]|nr:thioredoxin domain-containing protein [Rhodospirillales bacterium]
FASQDRWAFARGVNSTDELWKMAALAGMSRQTFDSAINDTALKTFILQEQDAAQKKWKVDSTPTFIINGKKEAGALDYAAFEKLVSASA